MLVCTFDENLKYMGGDQMSSLTSANDHWLLYIEIIYVNENEKLMKFYKHASFRHQFIHPRTYK